MKKTTLALIFAMMLVLAVAITAGATNFTAGEDGKYTIADYALSEAGVTASKEGDMYGMLVIEATESVEELTVKEEDIRYIDQTEADAEGKISFDAFIPMDLTDAEKGQYLVFIGGEGLGKATQIGVLGAGTTTEPEVTNVTLTADSVNWEDVVTVNEIEVGETLASAVTIGSTAAKATVDGTEYAGTITVVGGTEATTEAGTEAVTVKFVPTAVANTTFTPAEVTKEFNVTVKAAGSEPALKRGDANGDGGVDGQDHQRIYEHLNGSNPIAAGSAEYTAADANEDGGVDGQDHQRVYEHLNGSNPLS